MANSISYYWRHWAVLEDLTLNFYSGTLNLMLLHSELEVPLLNHESRSPHRAYLSGLPCGLQASVPFDKAYH
jgi:hypothetical protein